MSYFYTSENIRLKLAQSKGGKPINWLFIPGGPGADSSYLLSLLKEIEIEGNAWLVDFPGNGDHQFSKEDELSKWFELLLPLVKLFDNPVIVGHSFGAMLLLLEPKLENYLKGIFILNSAPCLWKEESEKLSQNLPLIHEKSEFIKYPNQINFEKALKASLPCYFTAETLEKGHLLFKDLPFPYQTSLKMITFLNKRNYKASYIPQNVKTVIVGGELDTINPFTLFEQDERFNRENIKRVCLKEAGHWAWIEQPAEIKALFAKFQKDLDLREDFNE